MNPINEAITGTNPVKWQIGSETAIACSAGSGINLGTYTCDAKSTSTGNNLPLKITVKDDVTDRPVSYLEDAGDSVLRVHGPWLIDILPSDYSAAISTVLGLQFSYTVGVDYEITIILNDVYGNPVGAAPSSCPVIDLEFITTSPTATHPTSKVSTTCNSDGTITFVFKPQSSVTSATLQLEVGGTQVSSLAPSTNIVVSSNFASALSSICVITNTGGAYTAGSSVDVTCTPKDVGMNLPSGPGYNLYVAMHLRLQTDPLVNIVDVLDFVSANSNYRESINLVATVAGKYDYYVELEQPGGLMAQYYENDDFTQVIGTSSGVVTATLFPGDPEIRYTRIDPSINFDWSNDGVAIAGVSATAIQWSGYIHFPTGATTCTLQGNGEVRFELGGNLIYTNFGTTGTFTPTAFTVTAGRYTILL